MQKECHISLVLSMLVGKHGVKTVDHIITRLDLSFVMNHLAALKRRSASTDDGGQDSRLLE